MNSMFVWAQSTSIPYDGFKTGRNITLKLTDIDYIRQRIPEVEFIAPRNVRGVFGGAVPLVVRKNNRVITMFMEIFLNTLRLQQKRFTKEDVL